MGVYRSRTGKGAIREGSGRFLVSPHRRRGVLSLGAALRPFQSDSDSAGVAVEVPTGVPEEVVLQTAFARVVDSALSLQIYSVLGGTTRVCD